MGDLVTETVNGSLYYAPRSSFERVLKSNISAYDKAGIFADLCRLNALYMIASAGSGHIGSSFSSMDLISWIYLNELKSENDLYFSSKGHDAPGLYALLIGLGRLKEDNLHNLRRIDGLPGHPDVHVEGMEANTGSLGMGISKAKGMAYAFRRKGIKAKLFVMCGDGELQEGQIWESLVSAANCKYSEITVIVDHNKIQSDYSVERTSSLGDLEAKFAAFDWRVERVDGHDFAAFDNALRVIEGDERPRVIIADTVKGKGVDFMEGTSVDSDVELFRFHSGAPQAADYGAAAQQLINRINAAVEALEQPRLEFERVERSQPAAPTDETVRLFPAYTEALLEQARRNEDIIALDADLQLDMGLIPFRDVFPERFVECGIAEMDMISQAGGMALKGLLPVTHSFACFLSTRPNEQIYNNATEDTKVLHVVGLSGVLPAGPGHSHQSVRDISCLGAVPGMAMVEPSHPEEVAPLLAYLLNDHDGPGYLRLVSIPYNPAPPPEGAFTPVKGQGRILKTGTDVALVSYGLVMLSETFKAASQLEDEGVSCTVINMPFLNVVDGRWLADALGDSRLLVAVDNHYITQGMGDAAITALAEAGALSARKVVKLGLHNVPPSGSNAEVLEAVGLDAARIADAVRSAL